MFQYHLRSLLTLVAAMGILSVTSRYSIALTLPMSIIAVIALTRGRPIFGMLGTVGGGVAGFIVGGILTELVFPFPAFFTMGSMQRHDTRLFVVAIRFGYIGMAIGWLVGREIAKVVAEPPGVFSRSSAE